MIFAGVEALADACGAEAVAKYIDRWRGRVPARHETAIGGGARYGYAGGREAQYDLDVDAACRGEIERREDDAEAGRALR